MRKLLFFLGIVITTTAYTQSTNHGKIRITVTNEKVSCIGKCTVELLKAKDSSLVKAAITDNNGVAEFEKISIWILFIKSKHG